MGEAALKHATHEDLFDLLANRVGEIIHGQLHSHPRPAPRHALAYSETAWFKLAPDWVCEILSRGTARVDRALKMPIYAQEGIPHLWLVDPDARTLEVFQLHSDGHWLLLDTLKDDDSVRRPPFDAIAFPLANL